MGRDEINVVIADDNLMLRNGLRKFLEKSPDIKVVGEAYNGQEAVELVWVLMPDVLILDLRMPVLDGLSALKLLRNDNNKIAVIILTMSEDPYYVYESIHCGAHSYILKEDAAALILSAVHRAFRGEKGSLSPRIARYSHIL